MFLLDLFNVTNYISLTVNALSKAENTDVSLALHTSNITFY